MSASAAVLAAVGVAGVVLAFLVMNWALGRADRAGLYGFVGSWLGVTTRRGDPFGVTTGIPVGGAERTPVATGNYGQIGWVAVVEERTSSTTAMVCYLWVNAGMDADIVRREDATERTHATRGGLADRVVRAVGTNVPEARTVWTSSGSAPPPTRDEYDRASAPLRPVGLTGDSPPGAVGLALPADAVTNPVAWLRWLRAVVHAVQDGDVPPSPPSVGFG